MIDAERYAGVALLLSLYELLLGKRPLLSLWYVNVAAPFNKYLILG